MERPNKNQTAPLLSLLSFHWLNETVAKASRMPHLPLDELPELSDAYRTKNLVKDSFPVCVNRFCYDFYSNYSCTSTSTHFSSARRRICSGDFCVFAVSCRYLFTCEQQSQQVLCQGREYITIASLAAISVWVQEQNILFATHSDIGRYFSCATDRYEGPPFVSCVFHSQT